MPNSLGMKSEEFLTIAIAIKRFYKGQISEKDFINIINSTSAIYVKTILPDLDNFKLLKDAERIRNGKYTIKDVQGFVISYNDQKWNICVNRDVIEALANNGDEEEIEKLARLEAYEEALKREKGETPIATRTLEGFKSHLEAIDKQHYDRQKFIENQQKEIFEKKKKEIFKANKR